MKNQLFIFSVLSLFLFPVVSFAQSTNLGTAANFVLFTTTGAVGNTGTSSIIGKIGTNNGAITGFALTPGQDENANSVTAQAASDLQTAYDAMYLEPQTFPDHSAILGNGETLIPGTYSIPQAASIEGILTLDAQGNSNAIFIFKIQGAFSPGPSSQISLIGGTQACNVFWLAEGGAIAFATLSDMKGNFIANPGAVSMAASSQLEGRLLSTTGAVAVDNVTAGLPICTVLPVTLLNFTAIKNNALIDLLWKVDNESSFAAYYLERSAEGRNFTTIGTTVPTSGQGIKNYSYTDNSPLAAVNFYRLKMTDIDGRSKYSPVLRMSMNKRKEILVYPNPSLNHHVQLQMYGQLTGEHILDFYNSNGIKVMSSKIFQGATDATISIMLDKKIPAGYYFLQVTDPGKEIQTLKILLQ